MNYQGIIWAGIWVQNLRACITFYQDVLGLSLLNQGDTWANFDAGNGVMLELMIGGKASLTPKNQDQQPIFIGLRVADLDSAVAELKNKGVHFMGEIGRDGDTRWAQFQDLEGNVLEIKELP